MKKIRIIALALTLAVLCVSLCSCSKTLSGTYTASANVLGAVSGSVSYTFKGKNVTIELEGGVLGLTKAVSYEGTYEISENDDGTETIKITIDDPDASGYSGEFKFSEDKDADTIKIGLLTYTKTK